MTGITGMNGTLTQLMDQLAVHYGSDPALIYQDHSLSFATLVGRSRRVARSLHKLGVEPGDRVGLWLPNVPAYVILCLACARLGAMVVSINMRFGPAELEDLIERTGMSAIVLWPDFAGRDYLDDLGAVDYGVLRRLKLMIRYTEQDTAELIPGGLEHCFRERYRKLLQRSEHGEDASRPDQDLVLFSTSGTTARPKLPVHQHYGIARHCRMIAENFGFARHEFSERDSQKRPGAVLGVVPLTGVFGFSTCFGALAAGRPVVLDTGFDAERAVHLIDRHDVRFVAGTDDMILPMLAADTRAHALPSVAFATGGSFNGDIVAMTKQADTRGLTFCGAFGMSEVQALFSRQDLDTPVAARGLGGGRPADPDAVVDVRDPDTGAPVARGSSGELVIRAPSLMHRYYADPDAGAAAMTADGFFRTGDLGYLDSSRPVFIYQSRIGDVMRLGGYLVNPVEIEEAVEQVHGITRCHVVAIAVPRSDGAALRMRAIAFVKQKFNSLNLEEKIQEHCRDRMAHYKVPYRVFSIDSFPITESPNGIKVQRKVLRQWAYEKLSLPVDAVT